MDVDWIVGIMVFLVFVSWGFSFYFSLFAETGDQFELMAGVEREKVMTFVSADVYDIPVRYESSHVVSSGVLKAKSVWYHGEKNSARVFSGPGGSQQVPCKVEGDDLYWQADLSPGYNYFRIEVAGVNGTTNCTGTFSNASFNLTAPWAFEKRGMVSLTRINEMTGMGYDDFRDLIGMNGDFRITFKRPGNTTSYGKSIPSGPISVSSRETQRKVYETYEIANVTIAIW